MHRSTRSLVAGHGLALLALVAAHGGVAAQDFNWKKHQGKTITFLANNNPVSNAILKYKADFEAQKSRLLSSI